LSQPGTPEAMQQLQVKLHGQEPAQAPPTPAMPAQILSQTVSQQNASIPQTQASHAASLQPEPKLGVQQSPPAVACMQKMLANSNEKIDVHRRATGRVQEFLIPTSSRPGCCLSTEFRFRRCECARK
jgi:hypothetical protein